MRYVIELYKSNREADEFDEPGIKKDLEKACGKGTNLHEIVKFTIGKQDKKIYVVTSTDKMSEVMGTIFSIAVKYSLRTYGSDEFILNVQGP